MKLYIVNHTFLLGGNNKNEYGALRLPYITTSLLDAMRYIMNFSTMGWEKSPKRIRRVTPKKVIKKIEQKNSQYEYPLASYVGTRKGIDENEKIYFAIYVKQL
jgi:hypothetical protein